MFRIRVSQDYETQAKIETNYLSVDDYFLAHPEHREIARDAILEYLASDLEHKRVVKAQLSKMKLV